VTRTPLSRSKGQGQGHRGRGHIVAASRTCCFKWVRYLLSVFRDIGSVFHFASKRCANPKILLPSKSAPSCQMAEGGSELSALDASNPGELSPQVQYKLTCSIAHCFYARDARYNTTRTKPIVKLHEPSVSPIILVFPHSGSWEIVAGFSTTGR